MIGRWLILVLALLMVMAGRSGAQVFEAEPSSLGPMPGDAGIVTDAPGGQEGILGGRLGPAFPRVPANVTRPGEGFLPPPSMPGVGEVAEVPGIELPLYGPLDLPEDREPAGPAGLSLDQAIARLMEVNLDLRAKALEIPQSLADELTAGLRGNPILFYDTQFIPYGRGFSDENAGGPTQYDLNVTVPLDLNGKRRARVAYVRRATQVLEAQYQDAVRLTIDLLYEAYVNVLSAQETERFARASVAGLDELLEDVQEARDQGEATLAEVERVRVQRDAARIGVFESSQAVREAKRGLIPLLNLSPAEAEALEFGGPLAVSLSTLPSPEALVQKAMQVRPDLLAFRLGLKAAESGVRLARAERFEDVYLLYQPYTAQDLRPFGQGVPTSWAAGVTIALPIFNRNQGNIRRAQLNVTQTQTELAVQEQLVVAEVLQAFDRFIAARYAVDEIAGDLLPISQGIARDALTRFRQGETEIDEYLEARRDLNDLVRQYRDALIRQRRSMLELNTAVGQRILP